MLHLKVTYFLSDHGKQYFPHWFDKVHKISALQDGFISIKYEQEQDIFIVYLVFESESKLDKWINQPQHDQLTTDIEKYFVRPLEVESKEI